MDLYSRASETRAKQAIHGEAGSAYIVTLLVMLILTVVGLALSLITRTELMLSSHERTMERSFYAADAGVAVATAQILHRGKTDPATLPMSDTRLGLNGGDPLVALRDRVEVSRSIPILDMPCDLCQVNSGDTTFHLINHAVTSVATREGSDANVPMAQSAVSAMILVQPWMRTTAAVATSSDEIDKMLN